MTKTSWVLLPLAAFAAWVVVRRLLGRPLSQHAINVQQSLLPLAYLAATSGLGIFWVANQLVALGVVGDPQDVDEHGGGPKATEENWTGLLGLDCKIGVGPSHLSPWNTG